MGGWEVLAMLFFGLLYVLWTVRSRGGSFVEGWGCLWGVRTYPDDGADYGEEPEGDEHDERMGRSLLWRIELTIDL